MSISMNTSNSFSHNYPTHLATNAPPNLATHKVALNSVSACKIMCQLVLELPHFTEQLLHLVKGVFHL